MIFLWSNNNLHNILSDLKFSKNGLAFDILLYSFD